MTETIDTAAAEKLLIEERDSVLRQLEEIGADESGQLNGTVDYGDAFADAGAVTAERTEVLRLANALKVRLERANVALGKIAAGNYGICETCGAASCTSISLLRAPRCSGPRASPTSGTPSTWHAVSR